MIPIEEKEEGLRDEKNRVKQRKRRERIVHGTEDQTHHAGRSEIIERENGGVPGRMGCKSISPGRRGQEED